MSGTHRDLPATRAPWSSGESDRPYAPAQRVEYAMRGQVEALGEAEGEPIRRPGGHPEHLTLYECAACPGLAVWGDRLEQHTRWHWDADR